MSIALQTVHLEKQFGGLTVTRDRMTDPEALIAALVAEAPLLGERIGPSLPDHWEAVSGVPYGWRALATEAASPGVSDPCAVRTKSRSSGKGFRSACNLFW